ncbi:MAG: prepilin-type N-terminal cleavage/methylation domain-containing protein [Candidatus Dependentiae bacterium]
MNTIGDAFTSEQPTACLPGLDPGSYILGPRSGRGRPAFSMLEILVVLFIIGMMASLVGPRMVKRSPDATWPAVSDEFNNMLYFARQEAITSQQVHRLVFDQKKGMARVEVDVGESKPGVRDYQEIHSHYFTSSYTLPDSLRLVSCKRGKKDLFDENKGIAYCYVVPHGLVEDLTLHLERAEADRTAAARLTVQPFLGSFTLQEE